MQFNKKYNSLGSWWPLLLLLLLTACADEKGESRASKPSYIYAHYQFTADESKGQVAGLLQFFEDGPRGEPLLLQTPAGIQVDGKVLTADSALRTGPFYEMVQPLQNFAGAHTITLTDEHGQTYKEEFAFEPLVLQTEIGQTIKRGNLELAVSGVQRGEKVRVLLVDIDFNTDDINRLQVLEDGKLVLTAEDLQQVATGPVTLMLYKEIERPLENSTATGGKFSLTYGLSREFELVE